jgi:hypothetical protein
VPQQNFTTSLVCKKLMTPPSQTARIATVHKKVKSLQSASAKFYNFNCSQKADTLKAKQFFFGKACL